MNGVPFETKFFANSSYNHSLFTPELLSFPEPHYILMEEGFKILKDTLELAQQKTKGV